MGSNRKNNPRAAVEKSPGSNPSTDAATERPLGSRNRSTSDQTLPPGNLLPGNQPLPEPPPTRKQFWLLLASGTALVAWMIALAVLSLSAKR